LTRNDVLKEPILATVFQTESYWKLLNRDLLCFDFIISSYMQKEFDLCPQTL